MDPAQRESPFDDLCVLQASTAAVRSLQLLAVLVATWQSDGGACFAEDSVTAVSASAAVQSLPYTLPALLKSHPWLGSRAAACGRLCKMLALPSGDASVREIAASVCLALRDQAPPETWDAISRHACAAL